MAKPMAVYEVRFYARVLRSAVALALGRLDLTWRQSWALAVALSAHRLKLEETRRVLAFERWTRRARFVNNDATVTVTRTLDGLFIARMARSTTPRSVHTDDIREAVEFIDEAVSEVPRTDDGWWRVR
jgi:hypothetical protein